MLFLSFAWRDIYAAAERALMYFMEFGYLNSIRKSTIVIFVEFLTLLWQTQQQMFLLVSGQHCVSIQVSLNVTKNLSVFLVFM